MKNKWITILVLIVSLQEGCSSNPSSASDSAVLVAFANKSQFTLEALFLHDQALNYKDQTNLLQVPMEPGESLSDLIPARFWYVTVYRRPNKDSDVLAYTSAQAWDASIYRSILYFDEQFRVQKALIEAPPPAETTAPGSLQGEESLAEISVNSMD